MKHTKGPWNVTFDGDGCHCDFGLGVFNTVESDELNDIEELKANASLISAAPEMLEALEESLRLIATAENNNAFKDCALPLIGQRTISKLENLIKKAKGEYETSTK